jgi:hypothetical protein
MYYIADLRRKYGLGVLIRWSTFILSDGALLSKDQSSDEGINSERELSSN